jgi:hypothetical protein
VNNGGGVVNRVLHFDSNIGQSASDKLTTRQMNISPTRLRLA